MTKDDIIRMAREAGINVEQGFLLRFVGVEEDLERFATLVYAEGHKDGLDDFEAGVLPAAIAAERNAIANEIQSEINDEIEDEAYCILVALLARVRARGQG